MLETTHLLRCSGYLLASGLLAVSQLVKPVRTEPSSASTSRIAFASNRDGNWEIYVADSDGQNQTRLTRRGDQDRFPLWSPDRSQIAFGSQVGGDHWELWVMNADGSNPRFLATDIAAKGHRQWSRDGKHIVFASEFGGDAEIATVEVASARVARLTTTPGDDSDPAWSPDGRQIAFSSSRDGNAEIYVMQANGTQPRRLTNHAAQDKCPHWSPDGSRIAFVSARNSVREVYIVRPANGALERLTTGAHATNDGARWSPNGDHIAVQSAQGDNYDIQLIRMSDRVRTTIASAPKFDGQLNWSPVRDALAFISARDGFDAAYVTDLSGKVRRLTSTPTLNPVWAP